MVVALYSVELSDEGFTCLAFDPGHVQTDMGGGHVSPRPPITWLCLLVYETLMFTLSTFPGPRTIAKFLIIAGPLDTPRKHQEHDRQDLLGLPGSERQILRRQG